MQKLKIYLGGSRGSWREEFRKVFPELEILEPFLKDKIALKDFTDADLQMVKESDICFIYISYPVHTGACVEAGYAYALGKEIILVFLLKSSIDPLLIAVSRKVFTDFDFALKWLKNDLKRKEEED